MRPVLQYAALGMQIGVLWVLLEQFVWWQAVLITWLSATSCLLVLLLGLPNALTKDPREWLPPDARERLND